jgi:hypothetical protein
MLSTDNGKKPAVSTMPRCRRDALRVDGLLRVMRLVLKLFSKGLG